MVHLAEARRLAAHHARPLRRAGPEIRRLCRSRPAGQARHRAAEPRPRRHPRHRAGGHVHAGQAVARPRTAGSRASPTRHPDPTLPAVIFNHQNAHVPEPRRALGAGAADRHQGRRRWPPIAAPRRSRPSRVPPTGTHPEDYHMPMRGLAQGLRARHRQAARSSPTTRPSASRSPTCCGRRMGDQIPTDPDGDRASRSARAGGSRTRRPRTELLEKAGFTKRGNNWYTPDGKPFTITRHGRGRGAPGDDPRRHDDRRSNGGSSASTPRPTSRRARCSTGATAATSRRDHQLERRDLGRPPGPVATSSTAGTRSSSRRPASRSRRATGSAGRSPELDKIIEQIRAIAFDDPKGVELGQRLRQAGGAGDADHPADGLQRLHGDGRHLLDRLSDRGRTPTPTRCRTGATRAT